MNYKTFFLFFVVLLMSFTNLPNKLNPNKVSAETEVTTVFSNESIHNLNRSLYFLI